ncbi:MAG TPA: GTP 3',8-cyclase MoaA [Deltaproteobacteria bacterium]|nr:GTP 3',8-cyclase MoaA [Deltaproteobacteria bacterium]
MVDSHKRRIDYLRISVTDRCNLRCLYCMPAEGLELAEHSSILRYEELLRIARTAVAHGVTRIRITGGEPLVRQGIVDFIGSLSGLDGLEDLSLTTNGVLLGGYARRLREAGLTRVNVSLDSLRRERFHRITRGDHLDRVLQGLETALAEGLSPVKVNVVVIKGFNDDEVRDFALLTRRHPYHVRFIEYMPFEVEARWERDKCVTTAELMETISAVEPLEPVEDGGRRTGPARRYRFRGAPGEVGFISPVSDHFCGTCNRLRLTADGKLRTCLFSDEELDLRRVLRGGAGDEEIARLLFHAVRTKPAGHNINDNIFKKCSRTMSLIGG